MALRMGRETREAKLNRATAIVALLRNEFPAAETALFHKNPFELLIATILSAQCTDVRVNKVTPKLFEVGPNPEKMLALGLERIEGLISSVNFFRTKAKNIYNCCAFLVSEFHSKVPEKIEDLIKLPGVGRKTANVVLGSAFQISSIVVDTHVLRLSNRFKFSTAKNAAEVEWDLEQIIDRKDWIDLSHLLILHGRKTCLARSPKCTHCVISRLCPSYAKKADAWKDY